jgi:hypothetical protein
VFLIPCEIRRWLCTVNCRGWMIVWFWVYLIMLSQVHRWGWLWVQVVLACFSARIPTFARKYSEKSQKFSFMVASTSSWNLILGSSATICQHILVWVKIGQ